MTGKSTAPTFGGATYSPRLGTIISPEGLPIKLRAQCLDVFRYLAGFPDALVSKEDIVNAVWGDISVTDDSLVQCISEIRKALDDSERCILKTIPKRGYMLVSDRQSTPQAIITEHENERASRQSFLFPRLIALCLLIVMAVTAYRLTLDSVAKAPNQDTADVDSAIDDTPTLSLSIFSSTDTEQLSAENHALFNELKVSLSRYRTVQLSDRDDSDYQLTLDTTNSNSDFGEQRLYLELKTTSDQSSLMARGYDLYNADQPMRELAVRMAAAVASPGVGAISEHLLATSRLKPVEEISRNECYANGFGCVKCSGEEDNVTKRAEACLAHLLERDPEDARAWGLQATIHAHQYLWANTLPEPLRSTPALRTHFKQLAINAATKAEALSDGKDSAIYWGMAEAYFASCQPDKLEVAVERGLAINPNDPNLLAAFGNWLSYSGKWDEGSLLTQRALEIEPADHEHWWWMGIAKTHYVKREFTQAYEMFLKSYDERNWLSHLQLAYTLPYLNRLDEARESVQRLRDLNPGITLESALEVYRTMCFPDNFLDDMKTALIAAGLGSRGESENYDRLVLPRAELIEVDGHTVEYLSVGQGEPIVFVHGAVSDYRTWGFYLLPISENHRYLSYSRRYFGTQDWPDQGETFSQTIFANELIGLIEGLELGAVHVVSWSNGVTPTLIAMAERPDLFKSALHYEPVEDDIFDGDTSIKDLQSAWYARWQEYGEALSINDVERAGELLIQTVFELEPGGYHNERELHQEVVRQNARTLSLQTSEDPLISCDWLARINVPTKIVGGADTHEYWQLMSRRFSECISTASYETIPDAKHDGAVDKVEELSAIIIDFADQHAQ